jgi:molybdopterin-guanine dinucleotide biosynthesis protein A
MPPSDDRGARILADATGVLVAGGRAVRMGGLQKGWLRADGEPIAERTVRLYRATFADLLIVANDPSPWVGLGARVVPDAIPAKGAPGGLHAALLHAKTEWIFTAGCDMPFLSAAGIALLAARRHGAPAVIPRWDGWLEPLHAFWSRSCLPAVERLLREGDPSMQSLARSIGARIVEEEEWRAIDPSGRAFENVNTPEDAERLGLASPSREPGDAQS